MLVLRKAWKRFLALQVSPQPKLEVHHELGSNRRQLETVYGQSKEKWGKLTDDDLTTIAGKREQLAGVLQKHYGIAKEQAEKDVDEFAKTLK